jgi:hypothetical protein
LLASERRGGGGNDCPLVLGSPGREKREGGEGRCGPARLTGPAGRIGGRKGENKVFFFSILFSKYVFKRFLKPFNFGSKPLIIENRMQQHECIIM